MRERLLICTHEGPHPGTRVTRDPWPLPDVLLDEGGEYRKIRESQLPAQEEDSRIVRGAEYEWVKNAGSKSKPESVKE